jgi:hypothetical protein
VQADKVGFARAYITLDSQGAVEAALRTEACIQGIRLEVKRAQDEAGDTGGEHLLFDGSSKHSQRGRDGDVSDGGQSREILGDLDSDAQALLNSLDAPCREAAVKVSLAHTVPMSSILLLLNTSAD